MVPPRSRSRRRWHQRCLADPEAQLPFSHPGLHPQHTERLAAYWGEMLGRPDAYSREMASSLTWCGSIRNGPDPSSTRRPSDASRSPWTTPASTTTKCCARPWSTGSPVGPGRRPHLRAAGVVPDDLTCRNGRGKAGRVESTKPRAGETGLRGRRRHRRGADFDALGMAILPAWTHLRLPFGASQRVGWPVISAMRS